MCYSLFSGTYLQELTFSGFTSQNSTNEVQTVEVSTPGSFRFGLFGVYTEPLTTTATETMVATAVNALPVWGADESVMVVRLPTETATFEFTFSSKRGKFFIYMSLNVESEPVGIHMLQHLRARLFKTNDVVS